MIRKDFLFSVFSLVISCTILPVASPSFAQSSNNSQRKNVVKKSDVYPAAPTPKPLPTIPATREEVALQSVPTDNREININNFTLVVSVDPKMSVEKRIFYEQVANFITKRKVLPPQERIDHFKGLYNENSPLVTGWGAHVTAVEPFEGGVVATLRVTAIHEYFVDNASVIERYVISNGRVRLLDMTPVVSPRLILGF